MYYSIDDVFVLLQESYQKMHVSDRELVTDYLDLKTFHSGSI